MGFVFGIIGGVLGSMIASGGWWFFGFVAGMAIGWLIYQQATLRAKLRELNLRVDDLVQGKQATATVARAEKKAPTVQERVSVYEPASIETPPEAEIMTPAESATRRDPSDTHTPKPAPRPVVHTRAPEPTPQPGIGAHTFEVARRWLTTGNVPVKVGVIISFFGVAFLLKYAVENSVFSIPISVRYLAVAGFATGLLVFGWKKREQNRAFALSIQGGGIGVLFLIVFAAYRMHELLPPFVAFSLLVLITVAAGMLAVRQESRALAILGTTGGFLAPLLISTGSGNHVALFAYYLILNCAVLVVAWYRPWRELNIIGFVFTFGVGTIWGYQYYVPELFATTEPFLVLYFLFYTAIAILFAFRAPPKLRGYVDGTLLFGTPTIAFALQTQLLSDTEYGLAISAAVVAAFYASIAVWLKRAQQENFELMTQTFIALAVAFATIAVPLALDDRWTAIAWALEGAALVWISVRQSTTLGKMSGTALSFGAGYQFVSYGWNSDLAIPVLNGNFVAAVLIAIAAIYSARMLLIDERRRDWQKMASAGLLIWGLCWWFGAGFSEISDRVPRSAELLTAVIYFASSFVALLVIANRLQWTLLWLLTVGALPWLGGLGLLANGWDNDAGLPVLNGNYLGGAMIAWMALYSSRKLSTDERGGPAFKPLPILLFVWGLAFWFGAGVMEVMDRVSVSKQLHGLLLFGTLSLAGMAFAGRHFRWVAYARVSLALLPALLLASLAYLLKHEHFFAGLGTLGWLTAIASHVWILYCYTSDQSREERLAHCWGGLFFVGLIAIEVFWQINERIVSNNVWAIAAGLITLAGGTYALLVAERRISWPFREFSEAYRAAALLLGMLYVFLVILVCFGNPGSPAPLPYIPVLNPFDLLSIIAVGLIWYALRLETKADRWGIGKQTGMPQMLLGGITLVLSTIAVVRAVHHFTGVDWNPGALMNSVGVQSTLSIYWAILGLSGMILGTRRVNRSIWMVGAGLMVVVVLKLFVIDLGNTGTVARIVSFLGVGVMLLVVGYFSPVPPLVEKADA